MEQEPNKVLSISYVNIKPPGDKHSARFKLGSTRSVLIRIPHQRALYFKALVSKRKQNLQLFFVTRKPSRRKAFFWKEIHTLIEALQNYFNHTICFVFLWSLNEVSHNMGRATFIFLDLTSTTPILGMGSKYFTLHQQHLPKRVWEFWVDLKLWWGWGWDFYDKI